MRYEHPICRPVTSGGVRGRNTAELARSPIKSFPLVQPSIGSGLGFAGSGSAADFRIGFIRGCGPVAYEFLSIPINNLGREPGERHGGRCGYNELRGELQLERLAESIELPQLHSFAARGHLRAYRSREISAIPRYQFLAERHTLRSQYVNR